MIQLFRTSSVAFVALALGSATSGCAEPTNTRPIEEFPVAAAWLETAPAGSAPTIVISAIKPTCEADPTRQEVRMILINPTNDRIEYSGYTVDSWSERPPLGEISPLYSQEKLDESGSWTAEGVGWCGTGAATMDVPPGHAGEFVAYLGDAGRFRIGVNVTLHGATGTTLAEIWSPAVGSGAASNRSIVPPEAKQP